MIELPPPTERHSEDAIRLADWVELNLLLGEVPQDTVSRTQAVDEVVRGPADEAADESDRELLWAQAELQVEDACTELRQRADWLEDRYPLALDSQAVWLRDDSKRQEVYRFLVLLRARQLYPRALEDDGKAAGLLFEDFVKHALGAYVGSPPEHRLRFGVAGGNRGDRLPHSLPEAVDEVSQRLYEERGEVPKNAKDDFKADVLAWRPFGDKRPGQLVIIGQATISPGDWMTKEPAKKWTDGRLIRFVARPVTAVAFAETLSLTPADTLRGLAVTFSSIPFDRLRLLSVLRDEDLPSDLRERMDAWAGEMRDRLSQ